jgi:hypothetical protein
MNGTQAAKIVARLVETGMSREAIAAALERTTSSFDKWAGGVTPRADTQNKLVALAKRRGVEVGQNGGSR